MFQTLVSHNDDLRRLVDKGYAVAFDSNYLIVRDIPYLNADGELQNGAIVTKLVFVDQAHVKQENHQIFFAGSSPHGLNGKPIPNLADRPAQLVLNKEVRDVVVQRSFSNKPRDTGKFRDFFEKIESYVAIISGPAMQLDDVSPFTFRAVKEVVPETTFKFHDTLTSRAEITDLALKFKEDVIAIIGLGGTGAYVLDLLVRTPVREIRGFDPDLFYVHNGYRSPGPLKEEEFNKPKAEVYRYRYESFRHGLSLASKFVDASCTDDLEGVTFAFVCVDKGSSRSDIFELLLSKHIPFIDVGMGLRRRDGGLSGMLRATYYSAEEGSGVREEGLAPTVDDPNDEYRTNVQIGELNALNACLAVLKFKQIRGFYLEGSSSYHLLFTTGDLKTATLER